MALQEEDMCMMRIILPLSVLSILSISPVVRAQRINVKIINRRASESSYIISIPGNFNAKTTSNGDGTATTTGTYTAPTSQSYNVQGATLILLLPDGRKAIVNCQYKHKMNWYGVAAVSPGTAVIERSCRQPYVTDVEANFKGDKAELTWTTSLDGKKKESETYKIIAIR
jgi:hypothetical protein